MKYPTYEAIPPLIADYVCTVAEEKTIEAIPLIEINNFLVELEEYFLKTEDLLENEGLLEKT